MYVLYNVGSELLVWGAAVCNILFGYVTGCPERCCTKILNLLNFDCFHLWLVSFICNILLYVGYKYLFLRLAGGLSLAVEGPSKAEISCHDNKDGTVSVSYLPTAPGEYKISVKFGDKHIKGSPYNAKITGGFGLL